VPQKSSTADKNQEDDIQTKLREVKQQDGGDRVGMNPTGGGDGGIYGGKKGLLLAVVVGVITVLVAIVMAVICVVFGKQRRRRGDKATNGAAFTLQSSSQGRHSSVGAVGLEGRCSDDMMELPDVLRTTDTFVGGGVGGATDEMSSLARSVPTTRKNSHVLTMTSPSATRACRVDAKSPGSVHKSVNSLQRNAWESMLTSSRPANRGGDALLGQGGVGGGFTVDEDRPLSISELPPPPAFLLDSDPVSCLAYDIQDGYRSGDSVDDDIDVIDFTIRAPSYSRES